MENHKIDVDHYNDVYNHVMEEFGKWLMEDLGISHLPQEVQDKVYNLAYEVGNSSGIVGIANGAQEFSGLALDAFNAGLNYSEEYKPSGMSGP